MMRKSPLEDPEAAAHAWARYKRLMRLMGLVTLATVAAALVVISQTSGEVSIHFYIAAGLGIGAMMLLTAALMGLIFLSSGTGHDESVEDSFSGEE